MSARQERRLPWFTSTATDHILIGLAYEKRARRKEASLDRAARGGCELKPGSAQ
jgi:hypothetical protein